MAVDVAMARPSRARGSGCGARRSSEDGRRSSHGALGELSEFTVRPLGSAASDLALDLTDPLGPEAISAALVACLTDATATPPTADALRSAPVGDRIAALLGIAASSGGSTFSVPLRCPVPECQDAIEIDLTWEEIESIAGDASSEPFGVIAGGIAYRMRRPTAVDQTEWQRTAAGSLRPADVIASLVVDGPRDRLSVERIAALEAALTEHDPLVDFGLTVVCPSCSTGSRHELSLTTIAGDALRRAQGLLLDDVHALARTYGWTETAILAIPDWRRARYRALIAADR